MPFHLTQESADYPPLLREIHDPPKQLWGEGDVRVLSQGVSIAIVGARECTPYGEREAHRFAKELVCAGVTVVSGLAYGIDTAAHEGALAGGGKTVAVLGCGLDIPYPSENLKLKKEIARSGAVVTEFPNGTEPAPWTFPQRNRIISGLSRGVLVVEAGLKSGSLITAKLALEEGREVFALPGNVDSPLSAGTHRLIQNGAKLAATIYDILEELKMDAVVARGERKIPEIPAEENKILTLLSDGPRYVDELVAMSGLSVEKVSVLLMEMEIEGKIKSLPGSRFERIG